MTWKVPHGKEVNEGIENTQGATTMTGAGIDFYRLLNLRMALRLAEKGMRMSSRGPAASTIARRELGLKGNIASLADQVDAMIQKIQEERRDG